MSKNFNHKNDRIIDLAVCYTDEKLNFKDLLTLKKFIYSNRNLKKIFFCNEVRNNKNSEPDVYNRYIE